MDRTRLAERDLRWLASPSSLRRGHRAEALAEAAAASRLFRLLHELDLSQARSSALARALELTPRQGIVEAGQQGYGGRVAVNSVRCGCWALLLHSSPCFRVRPALGLDEPLGVTGGLADLGGH